MRRLVALLVIVGLCSYALFVFADTALRKQFWMDEGFEVSDVCERPAAAMLLRGSFGCSPAPLFSIAHRLVVRSVEPLGLPTRLTYRSVSLAAATLALLVLVAGLRSRLGLPAGLVACAVLLADPGFHHYAQQNRAYISWAMATAVLVIATAESSVREHLRPRTAVAILLGAGLLAGMMATPGGGQAVVACAVFWFFRRALSGTPLGSRATLALAVGAVAILALDVHYWRGSVCRGWGGADALQLDLMTGRDRESQLRNAFQPLWPPAASALGWAARAAFVVGLLAPLGWWRRRRSLAAQERYAAALWLSCIGQLAVAIPVALSLLASHYLFLPRMFIFALVPRAALTGLGFWIAARALQATLARGTASAAGSAIAWAAAAGLTAGAMLEAQRIGSAWRFPLPPVGDISCAELKASELRLFEPKDTPDEVTLNFLVRLGRAFDACTATPFQPGPPRDLLAIDATVQPDWFRVVPRAPEGFRPIVVCGEEVTLRSGRFRGP